jgi:hypothetical protein
MLHTRGFLEVGVEKYLIRKASHHYANALIKVFLDQAVGAPIFNCAFFSSQVGITDYLALRDRDRVRVRVKVRVRVRVS